MAADSMVDVVAPISSTISPFSSWWGGGGSKSESIVGIDNDNEIYVQ